MIVDFSLQYCGLFRVFFSFLSTLRAAFLELALCSLCLNGVFSLGKLGVSASSSCL